MDCHPRRDPLEKHAGPSMGPTYIDMDKDPIAAWVAAVGLTYAEKARKHRTALTLGSA